MGGAGRVEGLCWLGIRYPVRISDMPYKYSWDGNMLRFGNEREASAITRDDLPRELARYFSTHDFMNYDVKDLWWEIGADNLVAWH